MSIDRGLSVALLALLALLIVQPAASAQEPADERAQEPVDDPDPDAPPRPDERPRDVGTVPDDAGPGEPPPIVDLEDPGLEQVQEPGLGSFFLTTFSFASAYDRLERDEAATPTDPDQDEEESEDFTGAHDGSEIAYLVRPSFLFVHKPNARGGVVAAYEPELETLQDDDDGDERISHSAGIVFERRMTRRTDLTTGASYLDTLDASRHLGGEASVLLPGHFEQERVYFGASHLWPRATRLHFYAQYSSAVSDEALDGTPFDVSDTTGTLALEQGIGRRSDVTVSYSYTETDLETPSTDVPAPARFSGPVDALRLGFGHRLSGGYSFHLTGGALRQQEESFEDGSSDDSISWIGSGELARVTDKLDLRLRYDRSLFALGYGDSELPGGIQDPLTVGTVLRDTVSDTLSFYLDVTPQSRVRLEQAVWLSRQSVVDGDDIESFVIGTLAEVLLSGQNVHRLILFSRLDYFDRNASELLGESLSRTRFSLGFRVGLTGPQTKAGQRLAWNELRKVLPSGGRL